VTSHRGLVQPVAEAAALCRAAGAPLRVDAAQARARQLSTVCFRWRDAPEGELDQRNTAILHELSRRGRVYLSSTRVRGAFALRACIINHRTTDADIAAIVEEVLAAAAATA